MILNVVLGNNIDTQNWIALLNKENKSPIIVLDYDYCGIPYKKNSIYYMSRDDLKSVLKKASYVYYHKSFYAFPGMSGQMSSLHIHKKNTDE